MMFLAFGQRAKPVAVVIKQAEGFSRNQTNRIICSARRQRHSQRLSQLDTPPVKESADERGTRVPKALMTIAKFRPQEKMFFQGHLTALNRAIETPKANASSPQAFMLFYQQNKGARSPRSRKVRSRRPANGTTSNSP